MLPSTYTCPRCKCHACYALHRQGIDWILSFFGLRPARCLTCGRKFYTRYEVAGDGTFIQDDRSDIESKGSHELERAA